MIGRTPVRRLAVGLALIVLATACDDSPALPAEHPTRQRSLSERIVGWARHASKMSAEHRSDLGLALAEASMPAVSGRLRIIVSGEDPVLARGSALALARTLHRRDGADGLVECWREDTNPFVRAACLDVLRDLDPAGFKALAETVASAQQPDLRARKAELEAPRPALPPSVPVMPLLDSDEASDRRRGLRLLLQLESAGAGEAGIDNAVVHALGDKDPQVALLASALLLRRSIRESPPPVSTAIPDGAMQ